MAAVKAIYHALDLLDRPILAGVMQEQPLPPDTLTLLKIVAGDEEALASAALATGAGPVNGFAKHQSSTFSASCLPRA